MASAAEQLAANFNFGNLGKAHELRQRIFFTLGALVVARLGTYIPMPGIDPAAHGAADAAAGRRPARRVQHPGGRRGQPHGDLRAGHHALHLRFDHHSADDHRVPRAGNPEEGRRGGPQGPQPIYPLRHGRPGHGPGLWHRHRAGALGPCRDQSRACSSASPP